MLHLLLACSPPSPTSTDSGDLTPTALWVETELAAGRVPQLNQLPAGPPPPFTAPDTIRVWRRSQGGSGSCDGVVDVIDFDTYVKHVVPHEWYASWHEESLRAGAIAVRSYSAWWVNAGGKYDCADVDDTSATQNYGDSTHPRSNDAVDYTDGIYAVDADGHVVFAEYSAENGDPTKYGVSEPLCSGESLYGHGRGMCQWGSQRWASQEGKTFPWIIAHYYPGASLVYPRESTVLTQPVALDLVEGESATVEATLRNDGTLTWTSATQLKPLDSSALVSTAPAMPGEVPLYGTTTVSIQVVAPSVDGETAFVERFGVWTEGDWAGDAEVVLNVTVRDAEQPGDSGATDSWGEPETSPLPGVQTELAAGCSTTPAFGGWLLGLVLLRRRRG